MPEISFLLTSNRGDSIISKVVANIQSLQLPSYEIVVASTTKIADSEYVRWVHDEREIGCVFGYNLAYKFSLGRYVILATDDHFFDERVAGVVADLDSRDCKYKILSITGEDGRPCYIPDDLPRHEIVRFPVMARETVDKYLGGYVYAPQFFHHYPDNWLGFWLGEMGEPCHEISYTKMHEIDHRCRHDYDEQDRSTLYRLVDNFRNGNLAYA